MIQRAPAILHRQTGFQRVPHSKGTPYDAIVRWRSRSGERPGCSSSADAVYSQGLRDGFADSAVSEAVANAIESRSVAKILEMTAVGESDMKL